MKLRLFASALALLSLSMGNGPGALEPPTRQQVEQYRMDGTLRARVEAARALGNHRVSPERIADLGRRLGVAGGVDGTSNTPPPGWRGMPTKGTVKIFALLIAFSDMPFRTSAVAVNGALFGDGTPSDFPMESLRNFYRRASYDQLEVEGATLGWYTAPYPRRNVPMTTAGREGLIREALDTFEAQGHDFSQYDNDGDGAIDYFLVIWTGPDTGWANFWWGYQTGFRDGSYRLDGKRLGAYSWQWEANPYPGTFSPGVTIHETGHALGLPDYYDYDDSVGPRGGVGGLDQMDANWGDHNCFSKFLLDWITPTFCGEPGAHAVSLRASDGSTDALLLMPGADPGEPFAEFFMVQNRRRAGNDAGYPADGFLVWHVDARLDATGWDFLYDNSYTDHKLLRLMEADGLESIEQNAWADAGDYYSAGRSMGPGTHPSSRRYLGSQTGVEVAGVSVGQTASFTASCAFSGPYLDFQGFSIVDRCPRGGGGDGAADPGEEVEIFPVLRNDGSAASPETLATLDTSAAGVEMTGATAGYPPIAAGQHASPSSGFRANLGPALSCGMQIPLHLGFGPAGGPASQADFSLGVGRTVMLSEIFDSWPLGDGWVVADDTASGMPWGSGLGYGCRTNLTGGTGDFASADADCAYLDGGITTTLTSPPLDLGGVAFASLRFKTNIQDYYGTTTGLVDATADGGATYTPLLSYRSETNLPVAGLQEVSLAPLVGAGEVFLRFRYETHAWEVWWQLDDLEVVTTCRTTLCAPPCPGTGRTIQSVQYSGANKTLKVFGTGLAAGDTVTINGAPMATKLKKAKLVATKVPKITRGSTVEVRVAAPEPACSSGAYMYKRP